MGTDRPLGSTIRRQPTLRVAVLAVLAILTVLAFWVRWGGARRDFWLDELTTAWVVRDGFAAIPAAPG